MQTFERRWLFIEERQVMGRNTGWCTEDG